jgi:hypothetical protein
MARPTRRGGNSSTKAELNQVRTFCDSIDQLDRHIVLDPCRQERRLIAVYSDDVSHENGRPVAEAARLPDLPIFPHSLREGGLLQPEVASHWPGLFRR